MFGLLHSVQVFILLKSVGLGMLFGLLWLLFDAFRRFVPHVWAAVMAEDVLFFCVAAVLTFLFLFAYNAGIPRLYVFFGEAAGLLLCGAVFRGVFVPLRAKRGNKRTLQ